VGNARPVEADPQVSVMLTRQLCDRPVQHLDVVPGVVAAGISWSQRDREHLVGVVAPHSEGMETVAPLKVALA